MRRKRPWLGRLGLLAGFGEEPLGVEVAAGGLVQPCLAAVILDRRDRLSGPLGLGGVAVGGPQWPQHLADPALAHADQAGDVGERKPLTTLDLPQPPELGDPLGAGQLPAS
jgi:hypothetical protein